VKAAALVDRELVPACRRELTFLDLIGVEGIAGLDLDIRQTALLCRGHGQGRGATASRQLLEEDDDTIARLRNSRTRLIAIE